MPDIIITIGGEAGQGVQTIGEVLSRILIRSGFYVFSIQDYHSRIRGSRAVGCWRCSRVTWKLCTGLLRVLFWQGPKHT